MFALFTSTLCIFTFHVVTFAHVGLCGDDLLRLAHLQASRLDKLQWNTKKFTYNVIFMYNGRLFNQITAQHTSTTKRAQSSGNLCKNVTCPNNHLPLIHTTAPLCYNICTYHGVMFAHIGHCSDEIYIFFRFTKITTRLRTAPLCFRIFTYPGVMFAHMGLCGDKIHVHFSSDLHK